MIKYLDKSGRTEDDAIAAAPPAVVRVSYEAPDEPEAAPAVAAPAAEEKAPAAQEAPKSAPAVTDENPDYAAIRAFLSGLLERMNVKADIEISPRDNGGVNVNLSGSGMGAIIGRRGETLEPMNSYERHVIHTALQNYEGVTTSSTGVEPNRRVVVSYVKPETPGNKPQSREWA